MEAHATIESIIVGGAFFAKFAIMVSTTDRRNRRAAAKAPRRHPRYAARAARAGLSQVATQEFAK